MRQNSKKTVLIVGGAGYIGSHVNKMLNDAGYQTIILDNLTTGNKKSIVCGTFIEGDMNDNALLDSIFSDYKIDAVMHFAAFIDVGESVNHPDKYYRNNVVNTLNLLNAMVRHHINTFIFSSTAAIFGMPQADYITETHPKNPINPYGASKLMVEQILHDYDKAYGLRSCCLRYFNAAGGDPDGLVKNYKQKESNLIPVVIRSFKYGNGEITVNGTDYETSDGTCVRDYIHICDLGLAHIAAMEQLWKGHPSTQFNLGNGRGFSVLEVIRSAEKVTGCRAKIIAGPRRQGDPPILLASSTKAKRELDWKPQYPNLETLIEHAWNALPEMEISQLKR